MIDLRTTYLGLSLKNPLVASSSPLSKKMATIGELEDNGVSAVVMYSLFEEQIKHESLELDHYLNLGTESFAEALTYFPEIHHYNVGPDEYLNRIRKAKETVQIPIIGSLNGISTGGWVETARLIEQAGADALELNIYYLPTDEKITSQELEKSYVDLVGDICKQIHIPLAVKLSPFFTSLPNLATRLVKAGADGLVFFNRFYQPDLDIEALEVVPSLALSTSDELRLPLRWVAILFGKLDADLALTSGVHTGEDVLKTVMAGANVAMVASEFIEKGPIRAKSIIEEMKAWMIKFEYESITQMHGSMSQKAVSEPAAFERANYMKVLNSIDNKLK